MLEPRVVSVALLFGSGCFVVANTDQPAADGHEHPTRLIEDLTAAWQAQEHADRNRGNLRPMLLKSEVSLAPVVLAAIRTGGFHAASFDEVIELVPESNAYTYVHADVYAPASIGATIEHQWRSSNLMGHAWDTFVRNSWRTVALLDELDSRPEWAGLCLTRDLPQLADVRRRVRCPAVLAESGSNIYILNRLPELAQVGLVLVDF